MIRPLSGSSSSLLCRNKYVMKSYSALVLLPLLLWGSSQLSFIFTSILVVRDSSYSLRRRDGSNNHAASSVSVELDLNENSTLYQDVHRMLHFPDESKLAIYFNKPRNCAQPQLIGRLSGRALATVMWERTFFIPYNNEHEEEDAIDNGTMWDVLIGHYQVPQLGTYFLEIIAVMCEELQYDSNFSATCLVDPDRHRLTQDDVFINASSLSSSMILYTAYHNDSNSYDVESPAGNNSSSVMVGYWWHDIDEQENETSFIPLHTRYQPQFCRDAENATSDRCTLATNLSRFDHYQFRFTSPEFQDERLRSILEGKLDKICIEGASHARRLRNHMGSVLSYLGATTIDITPTPIETRFVSDIDEEWINGIIDRNCTKVIIGSGQWDAGWPGDHPTLFPEYEQTLNTTVPLMLKMFTDANIQVYYRSTHYNPLGDIISSCPPTDWRSPRVIDMYNAITKRVCHQFGMPWINTNDIMGVVWDRAADWCHYDDVSSDMEARYILSQIFEQR